MALEIVREQAVDVVLLDLKLGDENGLQILKRLREVFARWFGKHEGSS